MRKIFALAFLLNILIAHAADTIRAPKFNFGGTKVAWHHRPIEINKVNQVGTILHLEQMSQLFPQIVKNGKVYFLLDDTPYGPEAGSTLACYDLKSGDSLWQKNYNRNYYYYGYRYIWDFREIGNNLEMFGGAVIDTTWGTKDFYTGFTCRRLINENGVDVEEYINKEVTGRVNFQQSSPPHYLEGTDYAFFYQRGGSFDTLYTDGVYPYIWNDSLKYRYIDKNKILFKEPNTTGLFLFGPAQLDAITYVYFARFYNFMTGKYKHYIWKTDIVGNYRDLKDISSTIGGANLDQYVIDKDTSGNLIRLKIFTRFEPYKQGNVGYLYLDRDGKIIKDQRAMQLDGKHVGHIVSIKLMESNDILHVIRFVEEDNIYFYTEKPNGQFIKCGELINNGDLRYAFLPKFIKQAETKDIILTFESSLDSIEGNQNFVEGGWPYICKIEAKELGLITRTETNSEVNIDIFPNPTNKVVKIQGDEVIDISNVIIQDIQGRNFKADYKNIENGIELDFDKLNDGVYFIKLINKKEQSIINKKVIKISHMK